MVGEPKVLPARAPTRAEQPYLGLAEAVADSKKAKEVRQAAYLHTVSSISFLDLSFIILISLPKFRNKFLK